MLMAFLGVFWKTLVVVMVMASKVSTATMAMEAPTATSAMGLKVEAKEGAVKKHTVPRINLQI